MTCPSPLDRVDVVGRALVPTRGVHGCSWGAVLDVLALRFSDLVQLPRTFLNCRGRCMHGPPSEISANWTHCDAECELVPTADLMSAIATLASPTRPRVLRVHHDVPLTESTVRSAKCKCKGAHRSYSTDRGGIIYLIMYIYIRAPLCAMSRLHYTIRVSCSACIGHAAVNASGREAARRSDGRRHGGGGGGGGGGLRAYLPSYRGGGRSNSSL